MDAFTRGLQFVLQYEGGYSNHPADPGGSTNKGITQKTYDAWLKEQCQPLADVQTITDDEVRAIYEQEYWLASRCHTLPPPIALCVFDAAVNCGVKRAGGWKLEMDSRSALMTTCSSEEQVRWYIDRRRSFYRQLKHFPTFGKGWFNRCAALEALCLSLAKEAV